MCWETEMNMYWKLLVYGYIMMWAHYGNTNSHLFEKRIEEEELLENQGRDKLTILQCLQGTFRPMTAKEKWHDTTHALRKQPSEMCQK